MRGQRPLSIVLALAVLLVAAIAASLFAGAAVAAVTTHVNLGFIVRSAAPLRVGYLGSLSPDWPSPISAPHAGLFAQGLNDLGYVDGKNVVVEYRFANGDFDRLPALAGELIARNVAVIVAGDSRAMRAAQDTTTVVPLIMTTSTDPVSSGRVQSLARPGGNITGLTLSTTPGLAGKRLEILTQAVPGVKRVGILWQQSQATIREWEQAEKAAHALDIELVSLEVRSTTRIGDVFEQARAAEVGALLVFGTPTLNAAMGPIASAALADRLPLIGSTDDWVQSGALLSYAADADDLYRRSAAYVDKILRGANAAELPVEQPLVFDLVVNLNTARQLGLRDIDQVLNQATHILR
jgi:putative tryptophan/tyrosine transport system substrate-binding protein